MIIASETAVGAPWLCEYVCVCMYCLCSISSDEDDEFMGSRELSTSERYTMIHV